MKRLLLLFGLVNENACINGSHSHACALVGYQIETIAIVTNFPLSRCLGHRGFYSTNEISRSVDERRFESWRPAIPVTLSCNFPSAGPLCGLRGLNITPKFPPFVSPSPLVLTTHYFGQSKIHSKLLLVRTILLRLKALHMRIGMSMKQGRGGYC
ncbi:hypothetical protein J1N35_037080 [Gossypium stocksii]|uniref:Uncharacterized protein n=1 Tax=Gossypium stocksii TaxID=47602 RepID=A0A9D3UJ06_9ROSI|nr:hypothetical protein J1N35_037080 [Gossypium stocksii]